MLLILLVLKLFSLPLIGLIRLVIKFLLSGRIRLDHNQLLSATLTLLLSVFQLVKFPRRWVFHLFLFALKLLFKLKLSVVKPLVVLVRL